MCRHNSVSVPGVRPTHPEAYQALAHSILVYRYLLLHPINCLCPTQFLPISTSNGLAFAPEARFRSRHSPVLLASTTILPRRSRSRRRLRPEWQCLNRRRTWVRSRAQLGSDHRGAPHQALQTTALRPCGDTHHHQLSHLRRTAEHWFRPTPSFASIFLFCVYLHSSAISFCFSYTNALLVLSLGA